MDAQELTDRLQVEMPRGLRLLPFRVVPVVDLEEEDPYEYEAYLILDGIRCRMTCGPDILEGECSESVVRKVRDLLKAGRLELAAKLEKVVAELRR